MTVKVADDDEQYALSSKEFAITIPANAGNHVGEPDHHTGA